MGWRWRRRGGGYGADKATDAAPAPVSYAMISLPTITASAAWPPTLRVNQADSAPQHFLYFLPLPQGQSSLRPTFGSSRTTVSTAALRSGSQ